MFPTTLDQLKTASYTFKDYGVCRGCGEDIEWWSTPSGKSIPMNSMHAGSDAAVAHWTTCPEADSFRRPK
jgi:hypothetical protein